MGCDSVCGTDPRGARCGRPRTAIATTATSCAIPSDLTDAEWQLVKPLIPPAKRGGGKRTVNMREVVNGVMYVLSTGCQWRYIPKDLPPRSTVNGYFCLWGWDGTLEKMHHALYVKCREQAEREASPTACIIDSQSVKSAEKGGPAIDPHGFDAGKLIKGKKRHVLVDTLGLVLHALVTAADVQDRDGGVLLLSTLFGQFPFLRKLFADSAYAGPVFRARRRQRHAEPGDRNRQTSRSRQRLRRRTQALDRRAHHWLAQSMPSARQGLGEPQPQRARLPPPRLDPPHAQKAL